MVATCPPASVNCWLARVAIRNPTVLVMDEATAFMNPSTEATLQSDLDRLLRKELLL